VYADLLLLCSSVGASLLAMAACQPTNFFRMYPVQLWERACPRRRSDSRPISRRHTRINCGSEPAREDGLQADRNLADVLSTVGASLLAIATCQSTRYITDERPPQTGRPVGRLGRCCGVRPLVRPSAGYAQWATRHGCRVSRPRPWMADGGGPTEQDRSEGMPSLGEAPNVRGKSVWLLCAFQSDPL
jgi:hypothetical protein